MLLSNLGIGGLQGNLKVLNKGSSTELTKRFSPVLATMGASSKVFNTGMLISDGFTPSNSINRRNIVGCE